MTRRTCMLALVLMLATGLASCSLGSWRRASVPADPTAAPGAATGEVIPTTPVPAPEPAGTPTHAESAGPTVPPASGGRRSPTAASATPVASAVAAGTSGDPALASPSPVPTAVPPLPVIASRCCGVFAWLDARTLAAYDAAGGGQPSGTRLVDLMDGSRRYLAPHFGLPSSSGLISVSRPDAGQTDVLRADGTVAGVIGNGGTTTWISPDGARAAWLTRLPGVTPSSLIHRPVRLWVAGVDGSSARPVRDLLAAQLTWLPDSRRVVLLARNLDGSESGLWVIDVEAGTTTVVARAAFPQGLQLAPGGTRAVFLATLSPRPSDDGVWLVDLVAGTSRRLAYGGPFRWSAEDRSLWFLRFDGHPGGDELVLVEVESGDVQRRVGLPGHVRQGNWEVAPGHDAVAFWRDEDNAVVLYRLSY